MTRGERFFGTRIAAALGWLVVTAGAAVSDRPNIVLIVADDLGYGELGPYGQTEVQTPRVAQLAAEGLTFTQFYAGATVCAPARACLLTGRHGGRTSIRDIKEDSSLLPDEVTLAELLRGSGYYSACIGKWHLGDADTPGHPMLQGFDEFFGFANDGEGNVTLHYPTVLRRGFETVEYPENEGSFTTFSHDLFTDAALELIDRRSGEESPFFLFLNYYVPHRELEPVPDPPVAPNPLHHATYGSKDWSTKAKHKAAMISRMDRDIGRIVDRIDGLDLGDETLILVTSDNGPAQNDGVGPGGPFDSNGPLRAGKVSLYEGGIRVPLIARWSGAVRADSTSAQVGSFADIMPTFAALAQAGVPAAVTGTSLAPVLEDASARFAPAPLYWQRRPVTNNTAESRAARFDDWKVVEKAGGTIELYDLGADPGETSNVAASRPIERAQGVELLNRLEFRSVDAPSGLVAGWPFDEGGGASAMDLTGNANARSGGGAIEWTEDTPGAFENHRAAAFAGAGDRLFTMHPGVGGHEPRSVACWIRTTGGSQPIVSWGKPSHDGLYWELAVTAGGQPELSVGGSRVRALVSLNDGAWHHLAVTLASGRLGDAVFHIDGIGYPASGAVEATVNTEVFDGTYSPGGPSQTVIVGGNATAGFTGELDDLAIFSEALDAAEVEDLRQQGTAAVVGALEARVGLDDGSLVLRNHGTAALPVVGYTVTSRNGDLVPGNAIELFGEPRPGFYRARTSELVGDSGGSEVVLAPGGEASLGHLVRVGASGVRETLRVSVALADGSHRNAWLTVRGDPPAGGVPVGAARERRVIELENPGFENPPVTDSNAATVIGWIEESESQVFIVDHTGGQWGPPGMTQVGYFTNAPGGAIRQPLGHRWTGGDVYTLRLDAFEAGWRVTTAGDAIGVQIRQSGGSVLWDSGAIGLDGTLQGSEAALGWGAVDRHLEFEIRAEEFALGSEGEPIEIRIYRAGGVVWFDNLSFEVSVPLPGLRASALLPAGGVRLDAFGLDPGVEYAVFRGTDLVDFPDQVGAAVSGVGSHVFIDGVPPAGRAFYVLRQSLP